MNTLRTQLNVDKVKDHCHITRKQRDSAHRDCNFNFKLNCKILVVFHNLKYYDSHLIMQELGKFNIKVNVIPNELEKYISFIFNLKVFHQIAQFRLFSFSKDDFKCLNQEFDNDVFDLVKQKGVYPYEYMSDMKNFKEKIASKRKVLQFLN